MKQLKVLILLLTALLFSAPLHGGDEISVIVNKGANVSQMSKTDLRPIFQTTKTAWNGGRALPLNLPVSDSTRHGFDAAVLGLDPGRVARYWVDRKIRGGNPPPKDFPSAALILKIVSSKEEAIGYVPSDAVNSSVKVVAKIRGGEVLAP